MLGPVELRLDSHTVEIDPARDLATVRLTPKERDTLEADGFYIVRPSAWPPPAPAAGSAVVLAGFAQSQHYTAAVQLRNESTNLQPNYFSSRNLSLAMARIGGAGSRVASSFSLR